MKKKTNQKGLLVALNQRPIAYYPIYVNITGSICAAIALSQLMYWFSTGENPRGWSNLTRGPGQI